MKDLFPSSLTEEQVNRLISESDIIEAALDDVFSSSFNPTTDEVEDNTSCSDKTIKPVYIITNITDNTRS